MRELTRRDALASATALGTVAFAGCVADNDDDDDDSGTDNSTGSSGDGGETLELTDSNIETTETDCGHSDTVSVSVTDGDLVLTGVCPSSTPCYEAVLEDATLDDDVVSLAVDIEPDPPDGECVECTGEVSYEATLLFSESIEDPSVFEAVTVDHESGDEHTVVEDGSVVAGGDDADDSGGSSDGKSDTDDAIVEYSISSEALSGTGDVDEWEVDETDETVIIEGTFSTNTPCHEAVINGVDIVEEVLTVDIGARSTTAGDEVCIQPKGEVSYTAEITLATGITLEDVEVTHHGQGTDPESLGR